MVWFPAEESYFPLYRNVHTGSGTHPASIQRVRKYLSPRKKRPKREDDHCLLPKLRISGAVTPLHHEASWRAQGRAYHCMRYGLATHSRSSSMSSSVLQVLYPTPMVGGTKTRMAWYVVIIDFDIITYPKPQRSHPENSPHLL
jgi:hypothetical protein